MPELTNVAPQLTELDEPELAALTARPDPEVAWAWQRLVRSAVRVEGRTPPGTGRGEVTASARSIAQGSNNLPSASYTSGSTSKRPRVGGRPQPRVHRSPGGLPALDQGR
jgi:hypothetical protein